MLSDIRPINLLDGSHPGELSKLGIEHWDIELSLPPLRLGLEACVSEAMRTPPGAEYFELEHQLTRPDGSKRWVFSRGKITLWAGEKPLRAAGVSVDIDSQKRAHLDLERSYSQLRYHLENTPVATVEWDGDFQVVQWSSSAQQLFGWSAEEVLGKAPGEWKFVHEDDIATVTAHMAQLASGSLKRAFLLNRNYNKDGEIRFIEWYTSVLRDETTGALSLLSRALDVTERELALRSVQRRENELQSAADAIPHIVWTMTSAGETNFLNRRWSEYTGLPIEGDLIAGWQNSIRPDDLEGLAVTWSAALQQGKSFEGEVRFRRADGEYRWHLVRFVPVREEDGGIAKWVGTATDIDDIHHLQAELKKQTAELTRSNEVLQQLAYAAAHDLQEPIRTTGSFAGLLARRCGAQLDANGQEYLRLIQDGNTRMASLVKSLLNYAQDSAGALKLAKVSMDRVVLLATADLQARIDETEAVVTWSDLPDVSGDETQLIRLLQNLLANAIHYRHSERPPAISVTAIERGSSVLFGVHDNGIGIEAQYCEQIFGLFKRLHGTAVAGSGIGLASCRQIIERHGGRIWAESVYGEGSSFFFALPH